MAVFSGNGSASTPSFTFSAATTTGIFRPTADSFGIAANGTERIRADSTGITWIGDNIGTNPTAYTGANGLRLIVRQATNNSPVAVFYNGGGSAPATLHVIDDLTSTDHRGLVVAKADLTGPVLETRSDRIGIGATPTMSGTTGVTQGQIQTSTDIQVASHWFGRGPAQRSSNLRIGVFAMGDATNASSSANNVAIGSSALFKNTDGHYNTAVGGGGALKENTTGIFNTAFGYNAGGNISTGSYNNCFGVSAMGSTGAKTGSYNVCVGTGSGQDLTSGSYNHFIGHSAGADVTTDGQNVCIGYSAGRFAVNSTYVGHVAGTACTGGDNVAIGYSALSAATTAQANVVIGYAAGTDSTSNINCVVIGYNAEPSTASVNNEITLGNASITAIRAQVQTITALSDARDKTDVEPLAAGLDFVTRLNPVSFTWNMRDGGKVGIPGAGFIAQELQAVQEETGVTLPELVYDVNPEKLEAGYGALIPALVQAIKELKAELDELKSAK